MGVGVKPIKNPNRNYVMAILKNNKYKTNKNKINAIVAYNPGLKFSKLARNNNNNNIKNLLARANSRNNFQRLNNTIQFSNDVSLLASILSKEKQMAKNKFSSYIILKNSNGNPISLYNAVYGNKNSVQNYINRYSRNKMVSKNLNIVNGIRNVHLISNRFLSGQNLNKSR
jgi:hypothetical protein